MLVRVDSKQSTIATEIFCMMHVTRFCGQTKATHLFASLSQVIPGKQKRLGSEPPLGHVGASCAIAADE